MNVIYRLAAILVTVAWLSTAQAQNPLDSKPSGAATRPATRPTVVAASQPVRPVGSRPGFLDEKYPSGKAKASYAIDAKGVKSGPYTLFSEDGKRTERGNYKAGELDGTRQTFYPNGNVKLQETYLKGQLHGTVTEYDERGTAVRSAQYIAGAPLSDRVFIDGVLVYPRSPAIITAELDRIHKMKIETLPVAAAIPPHAGGNDSDADREDAVRRLMEYRYLCYVPYEGLKLDPLYSAYDEAAAGILATIGKLEHTPANPGWSDDQYKFAYNGTSHSNIFMSSKNAPQAIHSIDAYMDDSDPSNIDRVGHRRWCLNPRMGKVGIASFKGYSAMWSMDASRKDVPNFDFVAYPAPGAFPSTYFGARRAWSLSLNETVYQKPAANAVKATITPGQFQLAQNKLVPTGKPLEMDYNAVELGGFGIPNCIIFRPVGLKIDPGSSYVVDVEGVKLTNGKPAVIRYYVEFFKPG